MKQDRNLYIYNTLGKEVEELVHPRVAQSSTATGILPQSESDEYFSFAFPFGSCDFDDPQT
jgi:hypothetical protein